MKRIIIIILAAVMSALVTLPAEAQTFGGPEFMRGKKVFGGDIDLGFAGNCFHVGVAPQFGFRLTRSIEVGTRLGYDLYLYHDYTFGRYSCHYFSGAVYANIEILSGIYLHAEDEEMCLLIRGNAVNPNAPTWYNSVFVGGGYRQYFSGGYTFYSILYNLSWDYTFNNDSPYASPLVIRVGYCFTF